MCHCLKTAKYPESRTDSGHSTLSAGPGGLQLGIAQCPCAKPPYSLHSLAPTNRGTDKRCSHSLNNIRKQNEAEKMEGKPMGIVAEGVGFEPTIPGGIPVFKTGAIVHSAIPPRPLGLFMLAGNAPVCQSLKRSDRPLLQRVMSRPALTTTGKGSIAAFRALRGIVPF